MYTSCHKERPLTSSSCFLHVFNCTLSSSGYSVFFSRTGGHTGAGDRCPCRNERRHVSLGFPLCYSAAKGVKIELLRLELSPNVPESPAYPSLPLSLPIYGKEEGIEIL